MKLTKYNAAGWPLWAVTFKIGRVVDVAYIYSQNSRTIIIKAEQFREMCACDTDKRVSIESINLA